MALLPRHRKMLLVASIAFGETLLGSHRSAVNHGLRRGRQISIGRTIGCVALPIMLALAIGVSGCESPPAPTPLPPPPPPPPQQPSGRNCATVHDEFVGRDAGNYPIWTLRIGNSCDFNILVYARAHLYDMNRQYLWAIGQGDGYFGNRSVPLWLCETPTDGGCPFYNLDSFTLFFTSEPFEVSWTFTACNPERVGDCIDPPLPGP